MPSRRSEARPRTIRSLLLFAALIGAAPMARAADKQDAALTPEFYDEAADELLLFADVPTVYSAARQAQPISFSSVPISVVTAEDIHYGGLTTLSDLVQFVPGMDITYSDRNNASLGVRGLHYSVADRTLVLIDGRDATDPIYGGANFFFLPLFPEDIDQIEVVRGPGGAAWGANAFNGVINFITKEPADTLGVLLSTNLNEYGDTYTHARYGWRADHDLIIRFSAGYEDFESSDDAIENDGFVSRDFARNLRLNAEAVYRPDHHDKLSVGAGYAHLDRGDLIALGYPPTGYSRSDERIDVARAHARLEHSFLDGARLYLQWFGVYHDYLRPNLNDGRSLVNDVETQYDFNSADHRLSVGGNLRWVRLETARPVPTNVLPALEEDEYWAGVFVIDRWSLTPRLTLEGQARLDWYSETEVDWSARLAALYALDDRNRHVLRLAAARAFRAPSLLNRRIQMMIDPLPSPPFPADTYSAEITAADDIENETVWALEAGYHARFDQHWSFDINAYYQRYEDIIALGPLPDGMGLGRVLEEMDNFDGADAWGLEPQITWRRDNVVLSLWYAYNELHSDAYGQSLRAYNPARHKAGATARWFLPHDWTINANYRFAGKSRNQFDGSVAYVRSTQRLDLTLAKAVFDGRGELMLGLTDVLEQADAKVGEFFDPDPHETPGRTLFMRFQMNF